VLDRLLRLLHPVMPFVTDELWSALTGGDTVLTAAWPGQPAAAAAGGDAAGGDAARGDAARGDAAGGARQPAGDAAQAGLGALADPAAEREIDALMRLVTEVRRFRSDQGLRPTQPVPAVLAGIETTPLAAHEARIRALLRLTAAGQDFTPTASVQAEGVTVRLDTAATIDVAAERRRLAKDLAAAQAEVDSAQRKLSTPSFVERAPAPVVAKMRDRLAAAQAEITRIEGRLSALPPAGP
jgi:valyl-tRNA synthetase